MCPAGVYEIPDDAPESGTVDVIVNYTNCVQCGAITAKGGRLTPPEGGDGPLLHGHVGPAHARCAPTAGTHRLRRRNLLVFAHVRRRFLGVGVRRVRAGRRFRTSRRRPAPTPPNDQLRSFVCQKALDPPARAVSVQAVMRPVTGTSKMQMRFELMRQHQARTRDSWRCAAGGSGSWISPTDPTLGQQTGDVWILNHPVVELAAPATYRFRVTFSGSGRRARRSAPAHRMTSPTCYQPELRADLLVQSLSVDPDHSGAAAGQWAYTAVIANRGLTGAGAGSRSTFADGDSAPSSATVAWVEPKSSARQRFVAPPCTAGGTLTVTVDPTQTIDEYDFANNSLTIPCPAASSG